MGFYKDGKKEGEWKRFDVYLELAGMGFYKDGKKEIIRRIYALFLAFERGRDK